MLKLAWAALFGNPLYTVLGLGAVLLVTNGYVGIKAYQFGADRQIVLCQKRVDLINEKIRAANLEIKKQADKYDAAIAAIEKEREAETARADEAEALNNAFLGEYTDEVSKRADSCPISDDDARRLR